MRYEVWVWTGATSWRRMSRPFERESEAQDWALDLSEWARQRMEIRTVGDD